MKNLNITSKNNGTKTVLAGLLLLASSAAFAQQPQECAHLAAGVYQVKNSEKFCLNIEKLPETQASVQLLTESGIELYVGNLPRNSVRFSQKFDMTNLESGKYVLRVKQGKEVINKTIELDRVLPNRLLAERTVSFVN